jgi:hypothetical protein
MSRSLLSRLRSERDNRTDLYSLKKTVEVPSVEEVHEATGPASLY